jgi:hypothetical protein
MSEHKLLKRAECAQEVVGKTADAWRDHERQACSRAPAASTYHVLFFTPGGALTHMID